MTVHLVVPDTQVKPGVPTDHLLWIGKYILDYKPDTIIHLGDHADLPSLSTYDKGKKAHEGRRYDADVQAARDGMELLVKPLRGHQKRFKAADKYSKRSKKRYDPRMVITLGNHEERILRAVDNCSELDGIMGVHNLGYEDFGFEVIPFLQVIEIDGIQYSHFFPRGANGKVMQSKRGAPSAKAMVQREMISSTAGHTQGLDWFPYQSRTKRQYGLIAGSCYLHEENYLTPQGCAYWRGIVVKHEVHDGMYDPMFVSLDYLCRRYEQMPLDTFMAEKYGEEYA